MNWNNANKILREMVSGVLFKERIDIYRSLVEYCNTNVYLEKDRNAYGEFDLGEIKQIIKDIENGKTETRDCFETTLNIYSIEELENLKDLNFYLVIKPNNLFEIVKSDDINTYFRNNTSNSKPQKARITEDTWLYMSGLLSQQEENISILSDKIIQTYGTLLFAGVDAENEWDLTGSISINRVLDIIKNTQFMLGSGTLDIRNL